MTHTVIQRLEQSIPGIIPFKGSLVPVVNGAGTISANEVMFMAHLLLKATGEEYFGLGHLHYLFLGGAEEYGQKLGQIAQELGWMSFHETHGFEVQEDILQETLSNLTLTDLDLE